MPNKPKNPIFKVPCPATPPSVPIVLCLAAPGEV